MHTIDARGLACPQPVIMTQEALAHRTEPFAVLCSTEASKENIRRFLTSAQAAFVLESREEGFCFRVEPSAGAEAVASAPVTCAMQLSNRTLLFTSDTIGKEEVLGRKLMYGFIATLPKLALLPRKLVFVNAAVKLTTGANETIVQALEELQREGVQIISCGTCLDYFGLAAALRVGEVGSALDTLEALLNADNAITLG